MVEKLVLNVLSDTVIPIVAAELTAGNAAAAMLPAMVTAAKALAVLNFIPNSFLVPVDTVNDFVAYFMQAFEK
jgi:hypothetical protein